MKCRNSTEFLYEISSCCSILVKSCTNFAHDSTCISVFAGGIWHLRKVSRRSLLRHFFQNQSASEVPCSTCVGMPCTNFTYWRPLVTSILSASRHVLKKSCLCSVVRGWCDHLLIEIHPHFYHCSGIDSAAPLRSRSGIVGQPMTLEDNVTACQSRCFQDGAWCGAVHFFGARDRVSLSQFGVISFPCNFLKFEKKTSI